MKGQVLRVSTLFVILMLGVARVMAFQEPSRNGRLTDFEVRSQKRAEPISTSVEQEAAVERLRAQFPTVRVDFDSLTSSPRLISVRDGFLTEATAQSQAPAGVTSVLPANDPNQPVKKFLDEQRNLFGHGSEALSQTRVVREYVTAHNGMRTVAWQQEVDGIPVFEAILVAHMTRRGELINISSGFVPDPVAAANVGTSNRTALVSSSPLNGAAAVLAAARNVGESTEESEVESLGQGIGAEKKQQFRAPQLRGETTANLVWVPLSRQEFRLCWDIVLTSRLHGEMFRILVDAQTGGVIIRRGLTRHISNASYRVFPSDSPSPFSPGHPTPLTTQPALTNRALLTLPAFSTNASPGGWIDDGVNETMGNNVDAHADLNADDLPDLPRPTGSPFRVFDFAMDSATQDPTNYNPAAVVQLFYLCNLYHDKVYELGFTEPAGNFQLNNFGRGGLGGDPVLADAQDGGGFNNANFSTPPDGLSGRMQMYIFSGPSPRRDGDLDAEIVFHEYTHGLSWRLVGGGQGLGTSQSDGMGEGWSDFYGLTLLSEPADDVNGCYAAGGYATYQFIGLAQNYYYGIRRYPYSTDLTKNPLTFKDIDTSLAGLHTGIPRSPIIPILTTPSEVHNQGEVWCVTLWEARANLINKHGWAVGNQLILQLVTDGMKLTPPAPNFLQARDAILQADLVNTGGANRAELWAAFAKRGMGVSATSPASSSNTGIVEAYDVPDDLFILPVLVLSAGGNVGGPFTTNPASFVLTNTGGSIINWSLENISSWINVAPSSGTLLVGGAAVTVNVTIQPEANTFPLGTYTTLLQFTDETSGVVQSRTFELNVVGLNMADDFDPDLDLSQWSAFGGTVGSTVRAVNYGDYTSFPNSLWFGDANTRFATTIPIDTRGGGTVSFSVRLAEGVTSTWEQADALPSEGVVLECSTNAGSSWTVLGSYDTAAYYNWTAESLPIPPAAQAIATRFRWRQKSHSGAGFDHWALEDVSINAVPALYLGLLMPTNSVEGTPYVMGTVTATPAPIVDTVVNVDSSDNSEVVPSSPIVILAGQTNADVVLYITDDGELDGSQSATITVSAAGFQNGAGLLVVDDNEIAALSVSLPVNTTEGAGTLTGTVRITNAIPDADILVTLTSSDTTEVQLPATVLIPAGRTSAVFTVTVVNDALIDGAQTATVTAHVASWSNGVSSIIVLDNETLNLTVSLPVSAYENSGVMGGAGQVSISGALSSNLMVSLFSSDITELAVPANVTITAGQTNGNFNLIMVDDGLLDGAQTVWVTGSAPGFVTSSNSLSILDDETPVLVVTDASANEGNSGSSNLLFNLTLLRSPIAPASLNFTTTNGTALAGSDYVATNGVLNFAPGQTNAVIAVRIFGDTNNEPSETFSILLSNPTNCVLGTVSASGTIQDDDTPVVAVYDDPLYVDTTSGGTAAESDNVQASLTNLGFAVVTFTNIVQAATNYQCLLFPELENGSLGPALSSPQRAALSNFVAQGGTIVVVGSNGSSAAALLNSVFNWSLVELSAAANFSLTAQSINTQFDNDPVLLPWANATTALAIDTLPVGARSIYETNGQSAVALMSSGAGVVVFLGWDWFDAMPIGTQDGGWLAILDSAVRQRALAPSPLIVASGSALVFDSCGGGNGVIDPNEPVILRFALQNIGNVSTTNLVATLLPTGGVISPSSPRFYGALMPGEVAMSNTFSLMATGSCGGTLVATLQLQDGTNNLGTVSFSFQLGVSTIALSQDFDGVTPPSLPVGWTAALTGAGSAWTSSSALRDTVPNAVFAPDPGSTCNNTLTSPSFLMTTSSGQLTFRHAYSTESCCDGGLLEISIAGGAFTDILAAGGSFVTNGYSGGTGWGGTSTNFPSFITTIVNLPPAAQGQSVQLRWRFVADGSVPGIGWYVDSVLVGGGFNCCVPPPEPVIAFQPGDTNVIARGVASFTVMVSGLTPLSYQWKKDGVDLSLGTNQTLSLSNVTTNDAGSYWVFVTNAYGSATSSKAHLTVTQPEVVNPSPIVIADASAASPYPSTITVSGLTGAVANVTVALRGVNHSFPDDLDILLVSPSGANVLLMSDAGGFADLSGAMLFFDDAAATSLPDSSQIVSGSYRPTNFGSGDAFPAPAPTGTYGTNLAALRGGNPNGLWNLFVYDDEAGDAGSINAGWSLQITLAPGPLEFLPVQLIGGQIQLRFATLPGQSYTVQYKNSLTDAVWSDLQLVTGDGTIKSVLDPAIGSARFYRIQTHTSLQ